MTGIIEEVPYAEWVRQACSRTASFVPGAPAPCGLEGREARLAALLAPGGAMPAYLCRAAAADAGEEVAARAHALVEALCQAAVREPTAAFVDLGAVRGPDAQATVLLVDTASPLPPGWLVAVFPVEVGALVAGGRRELRTLHARITTWRGVYARKSAGGRSV